MRPEEEQKLSGEVVRVRFANTDNNYYVFVMDSPDLHDQIVVQGNASDLQIKAGAEVTVNGAFQDHPKYGRQFRANQIILTPPNTSDEVERYLGSGIVKGIGKKTAEKIVETFGENSLKVIRSDPERLSRVSGVGRHRADLLSKAFESHDESQEAIQYLVGKGISTNLSTKIYQRYKAETIAVVSQDPYRLSRDLHGVGFTTADEIARNSLKLAVDSPQRLKAGVFYALEKARDDGHCYLPGEVLMQRACALLGLDSTYDLTPHVYDLEAEGFIVVDEERVYLNVYIQQKFSVLNLLREDVAQQILPSFQKTINQSIESGTS
ncbi:MAG: ATP-dependent RecD-like DNA helicase [Bdellovibrionota bacterium]